MRDLQTLEADRRKLLAVERLVMETVSFNFRVRMPFPYVIKVARDLKSKYRATSSTVEHISYISLVGKYITKLAWTLAIDRWIISCPTIQPLPNSEHLAPPATEQRCRYSFLHM